MHFMHCFHIAHSSFQIDTGVFLFFERYFKVGKCFALKEHGWLMSAS